MTRNIINAKIKISYWYLKFSLHIQFIGIILYVMEVQRNTKSDSCDKVGTFLHIFWIFSTDLR